MMVINVVQSFSPSKNAAVKRVAGHLKINQAWIRLSEPDSLCQRRNHAIPTVNSRVEAQSS